MPTPKTVQQYGSSGKEPSSSSGTGGLAPAPADVEKFHTNDDTDTRVESHHHTLGPAPTQSSPGDHTHDGGSSSPLLSGVTISGSRGGNVALLSVIQALVKLGATDSSTV